MTTLRIPDQFANEIVEHSRTELPNECCGLLAGHGDTVTHRFPLVNELASPTRFRSQSESMFQAMKTIRLFNLDVLAIYHSHPMSHAEPSRADIEEANWPGVATVIVSLKSEVAVIRAWRIADGIIDEIAIDVSSE